MGSWLRGVTQLGGKEGHPCAARRQGTVVHRGFPKRAAPS